MKTLILATASAAALLVAAPAFAADLAVVEPVPSFSWTGAYVGVTAGYSFGDHKIRTSGRDAATRANVAGNLRPSRRNIDGDGFTVGGTVGYNVQLDGSPVVFGIEADLSYTDIDDKKTFNATGGNGGNIRSRFRQELEYLGTVRGRLGYAYDRLLIFGTGGLAFGKVKTEARFFNNDIGPAAGANQAGALGFSGGRSRVEYGYVIGGGLEYAVTDNITVKGEYLYYDLGKSSINVNNTGIGGAVPAAQVGYKSKFETDGHLVRVGLNYKF